MSKSFLQDEQGNWSMGRCMLLCSLVITYGLIICDMFVSVDVPAPAYALLATIFAGLLTWVAGPRVMQYVGPVVSAVASAAKQRLQGTDNFREDDERGS